MVPKASNYLWDKLIWILYDQHYIMQEAWEWDVENYKQEFDGKAGFHQTIIEEGNAYF